MEVPFVPYCYHIPAKTSGIRTLTGIMGCLELHALVKRRPGEDPRNNSRLFSRRAKS